MIGASFLLIGISALCQVAAATNTGVPVFIWGTASHYTPVTALKSYTTTEFSDIMANYMNDNTLGIVILDPKLTNEDISLCRTSSGVTCFNEIKKIPNKLYLSSVNDPIEVLQSLNGDLVHQPDVYVNENGMINTPIEPEAGQFVFVHLGDGKPDESHTEALIRHDRIVGELTKNLELKNKNLIIIYMGIPKSGGRFVREIGTNETAPAANAPAANAPAAPGTQPAGAAVPPAAGVSTSPNASGTKVEASPRATPNEEAIANGTLFQHERLLFYFKSINSIKDGVETPITFTKFTVTETAEKTQLMVDLSDAGTNRLTFNVSTGGGYWTVHEFEYNSEKLWSSVDIATVDGFSFHCSPGITFKKIDTKNTFVTTLRMIGMQVEANFGDGTDVMNRFSDSWDCVGFTSPGIWGGLFVTFLMILILSVGLSWIMDIRTMDRFDDPKGKTITISVNE